MNYGVFIKDYAGVSTMLFSGVSSQDLAVRLSQAAQAAYDDGLMEQVEERAFRLGTLDGRPTS